MLKPSNSRIGLATIVASVAVGLFFLVGVTCAVKVCEVVSAPTEDDGDDDNPPGEMADCGSNSATVKRYLLDAGYSNEAASGIMGNLAHESGYTPNKLNKGKNTQTCLVNDDFRLYTNGVRTSITDRYTTKYGVCTIKASGAFGLAQWLGEKIEKGLQNTADSMGLPVTSLKAQATFLVEQLNTKLFGNYYYQYFNTENLNKHTLQEVTYAFYRYVEAPGSAICVGVNGDGKHRGCGNGKVNNKLPPNMFNVNALLANPGDYALAYSSYTERYKTAQNAYAMDVSDCRLSDDPDNPSDPESPSDPSDPGSPDEPEPVPTVPETPSGDDDPAPTTSTGALGKQNVNNAISQMNSGVEKTQWLPSSSKSSKRIGINDNLKDCCGSGCSLIAVANAYGAIHDYSSGQIESFANNLASWTKTNISAPSEANMTKMVSHVGMTYKKIWSSKSTSTSSKVAEIRSALASGGAVIAGGDRQGTDSSFCTDARKSSGECAFTPGGHYIAIIGITADDKLVVANPGKSRGKNWIFPADNVLKYSNLGYVVK